MKKQKNLLLWKMLYVLIMIGIGYGVYASSKSLSYNWRWERIPQYLISFQPTDINAPFDGSVESVNPKEHKIVLKSDSGQTFVVTKYDKAIAHTGDLVFEGDTVATIKGWHLGSISWGLVMTLKISAVALVFAMIIGLFTGLARISHNPVLRYLSVTYIEVVRGTPLLVQIFIFYFFIGTVLNLDRFTAGVAALAVFTGAYIAEIIRAGIQSIHPGQMEAARSLGMNYIKAMVYVILPQAFKRTLPPLAGQFINLIKDSSLVSVISITDLTKAGREVVSSTFAPFEVWFTVALLYLVLTGSLSWVIQKLEKRLSASD
ncbi:amino acid ABC transporter permease [Marinomonas spartinae]|uniref:amino acid ABC transporter permease n=1 Tax=Marinomonas spartinae TaxID=1792290 RepID=UPI0018F202C4|nr:amino acid ABC transporter permease [Marinomonas spartinae]MBJ7553523.1 amino acid ABC transporter permease [Marinomonas spartinae]